MSRARALLTAAVLALAVTLAVSACGSRKVVIEKILVAACPEPADAAWRTKYWGLARIDACPAWARVPDASRAVVAVVDSGIEDHQDLPGRQLPVNGNQCPPGIPHTDPDGHGTKVAGIIGGQRAGTQAVGVAWSATLRAYKFLCPSGFLASRAAAALQAALGMSPLPDVVNASWSQLPQPSMPGEPHPADDAAIAAIDQAVSSNTTVLFVFAAPPGRGPYPVFVGRPNVLLVTASDDHDQIPRWAGRNASVVHLAAPGVAIATSDSAKPGATTMQGTSAAAAFVSGCAALVKLASTKPLSGAEVATQLTSTADSKLAGLIGGVIDGRRLNCGRAVSTLPP